MEVTKEIQKRAKMAGACSKPPLGAKVGDLPAEDLEWAETHLLVPSELAAIRASVTRVLGPIPLCLFGHSGSGTGTGYGTGSGDGSGTGSGTGSGDGE